MIKKRYISKMEGFMYASKAVAVCEFVKITLSGFIRASSEQEAVALFEEWIGKKLEGFDWDITCNDMERTND